MVTVRGLRLGALGVTVVTALSIGLFLYLLVGDGALESPSDFLVQVGFLAVVGGFALAGGLLTAHRPDQAIGWLMEGLAVSLALAALCERSAILAYERGDLAVSQWANLGFNVLNPMWLMMLVALAVMFPGGTVPGRRWRRALIAVVATQSASIAISPFVVYQGEAVTIPALWGDGLGGGELFPLSIPAWLLLLAAMLRIVQLLFRGSDIERRQIRWVALVLVLVLALLVGSTLVQGAADAAGIVAGLGIPIAIAIGVTRYRLYEIDRIVSRTVAFTVVGVVLGGLYVALAVFPFTLVVGASGGAPSWLVAASTLAGAALFSPLRRRVQRVVDRRFNRSRYDAEQVMERFSSRVREFTDVGAIASSLGRAVHEALQPAIVTIWVRGAS